MLSALKIALVLGAAAGTALGLTLPGLLADRPDSAETRLDDLRPGEPELAMLRPIAFRYRVAGEFTRAGAAVNAPVVSVRMARPLVIMRRQVTAAEYQDCVREGACQHSAQDYAHEHERPVVKVSWRDASAYAAALGLVGCFVPSGSRHSVSTKIRMLPPAVRRYSTLLAAIQL